MLFSFIVPVYNTSKYLAQCMDSLLCQKGADFEIVLVDDGSTDNSGKMCDDYAQKYPHIVRVIHKENEGSLLARHLGIAKSKGEWVVCVDSDDYIDDDLLTRINEMISKYHPDMVMFHYSYVNKYQETIPAMPAFEKDIVFESNIMNMVYEKKLTSDDINSMCLKAISRKVFDLNIEYDNCGIKRLCDDALQVLPLITNSKRIVYIREALYFYRKGHNSITSTRSYESWLETKTCFLITEKYLDIWKVSDELRQKFYTHNLEVLSNFVGWIFSQPENSLPDTPEKIIHTICESDAFLRCISMYNKVYTKTTYLRLRIPIIMKYIKKENIKGLRRFFLIERKLLSIR